MDMQVYTENELSFFIIIIIIILFLVDLTFQSNNEHNNLLTFTLHFDWNLRVIEKQQMIQPRYC